MKLTIEGPPEADAPPQPLGRRLVWFVLLWCGGLGATALAAYALRALIVR